MQAQHTLSELATETQEASNPYWRPGKGRPTRLENEPALAESIYQLIREGDSVTNAHIAVGVTHATESEWARKGKDGLEPYKGHYELCQTAKAVFQSSCTRSIRMIGLGALKGANWAALSWLLERRVPDEFYLSKRIELTGANGDPLNLQGKSTSELEKILKEVEHTSRLGDPKP